MSRPISSSLRKVCQYTCAEGVCAIQNSCPHAFDSACAISSKPKFRSPNEISPRPAPAVPDIEDLVKNIFKKTKRSSVAESIPEDQQQTRTEQIPKPLNSINFQDPPAETPKNPLSRWRSAEKSSFYQRPSPQSLIMYNSEEGRTLFKEAMAEGMLDGSFWDLSENFNTQSEVQLCGVASLSMVLNSLHVDPGRRWKGPWRWFEQELLGCCKPLNEMKDHGITLPELSSLAVCNGADVELHSANLCNENAFREHIKQVCSASNKVRGKHQQRLIIGYSRAELDQTGTGHFSPIAAYHPGSDHALVMDVARFKYMPYWAPVSQLFRSMQPLDDVSGAPRGYMLVSHPASAVDAAAAADVALAIATAANHSGNNSSSSNSGRTATAGSSSNRDYTTSSAAATASASANAFIAPQCHEHTQQQQQGTDDATAALSSARQQRSLGTSSPGMAGAPDLHVCWSQVSARFVERCYFLLGASATMPAGVGAGSSGAQALEAQREWLHAHYNSLPLHSLVGALTMNMSAPHLATDPMPTMAATAHTTPALPPMLHGDAAIASASAAIAAGSWGCGQVRVHSGANSASLPALHRLSAAALRSPLGPVAMRAMGGASSLQNYTGNVTGKHSSHAALATMLLLGCMPQGPPPCLDSCCKSKSKSKSKSGTESQSGSQTWVWPRVLRERLLPPHLRAEFEERAHQARRWGEGDVDVSGTGDAQGQRRQGENGEVWEQARRIGNLMQLQSSQSPSERWEFAMEMSKHSVACAC